MVRTPPHPRDSVAASLLMLHCNGRVSGTMGAPLRKRGALEVHHFNASRAAVERVRDPCHPSRRTACHNSCCMNSKYRRAPRSPLNIAVACPTNRARSLVWIGCALGLVPNRRPACLWVACSLFGGTDVIIVVVSQKNTKHWKRLSGSKRHLDVLMFRPTSR